MWRLSPFMKIIVTVKRVIDPYEKVRPNSAGTSIETSGVKFNINPFDEIAMEEAARIKERIPGTEVIAVSVGDSSCEEQLRKALAMGADRAILVETSRPMDSPMIANELAAVAAVEKPDIVLMGKQATDDDNNQAAQMLAAKLGWAQATFASKIEVEGSSATVTRETDTGDETLNVPLPAVISADLRLNEPRYIALPGIIKAKSKPLARQPETGTGQPRTVTKIVELPAARAAGRKVANVDELISALKDRGAI